MMIVSFVYCIDDVYYWCNVIVL